MTTAAKTNLHDLRERDRAHDEMMAIIAKRGGKTLAEMRGLSMADKDAFIVKYQDAK